MLTVMQQSRDNIVAVQGTGKVTEQDYQKVLIPQLEQVLKDHDKARFLYYLDDNFEGWELGAMWEDTKFGMRHKNDFDKIAVVGGPKWVAWGTRLIGHFMEGQVKTYAPEELQSAWNWLES